MNLSLNTRNVLSCFADKEEGDKRVAAQGQRRGQGRQGPLPPLRLGRQREEGGLSSFAEDQPNTLPYPQGERLLEAAVFCL